MMKESKLAHSLRLIFAGSMSIGMSAGLGMTAAHADDAPVQRVEVTGSSIKGTAAQSASPITIIKTADLAKAGITTAEEAVAAIAANQTSFSSSNNVGASKTSGPTADLRGLGANKTLVLLNGRRVANSAFDGSSVDLSIIPLDALDHIEVLHAGASAVYGTDAIAGVINFITKRSYKGLVVSAEGSDPQHSGGGQTGSLNVTGGFGDLEKDGYNFFGVLDYQSDLGVKASDRGFTSQGGILPNVGLNQSSGTSFPANIYDPVTNGLGNPYASNCAKVPNSNPASNGTCRYNYAADVGIVPKVYNFAFFGHGTVKLDDNNNLGIEYLHSLSDIRTDVAPDVMAGINEGGTYTMPSTSKYFPGNGITPAVPNVYGSDPTNPTWINYRSVPLGGRVNDTLSTQDRILLSADGTWWNKWDYNAGLSYTQSFAEDRILAGYINDSQAQAAINNGTLNPFGTQAPADAGVPATLGLEGPYEQAKINTTNADFKISRPDLFTLPAGDVGFAVGTSFRHEDASYKVDPIAQYSESLGVQYGADAHGSRNVSAIFSELKVPVIKNLEVGLALRYDYYSDFGGTTNPRFNFRWQPFEQVVFRGAYTTGFRAPSLYEMNDPAAKTYTSGSYNDPVLCPNGPNGALGPGGNSVRDCQTQFYKQLGGNKDLKPETSRNYDFGVVIQPVENVSLSADYYNITMKHVIGVLGEGDIFNDPVKYANLFVRKADGSLDYVIDTNANLGGIKTSGLDLDFNWRIPTADLGTFNFELNGTYVNTYKFQTEEGGGWIDNAGVFSESSPPSTAGGTIFRWRHTAGLNWKFHDFGTLFQYQYESAYKDDNNPQNVDPAYLNHTVPSYSIFNLSETYTGIKNLTLTAGIKNVFNRNPPATNFLGNFQLGYNPTYSDPLGRVFFLRAGYKFF